VFSGRKGVALIAGCAASLALASSAVAKEGSSSVTGYAPITPHGFHAIKIRTDGTLTVGGQETLSVTRAPSRAKLKAYISPPPSATACFPDTFAFAGCFPEPLYGPAGRIRFKASRKGHATLTFTMPAAYEYLDLDDPLRSHPVYLVNGQTVHVDITTLTVEKKPHVKTTFEQDLGSAIAIVEVPTAPSP
jgi:hypothetical protein